MLCEELVSFLTEDIFLVEVKFKTQIPFESKGYLKIIIYFPALILVSVYL